MSEHPLCDRVRDVVTRVRKGLYVSSYKAAYEQCDELPRGTCFLNVCQYPLKKYEIESNRVHFPLIDKPGANSPERLIAALNLTCHLMRFEKSLLIHCAAGVSRSVVLCAWAVHYMERDMMRCEIDGFNAQLKVIRQKRGIPEAVSHIANDVRDIIKSGALNVPR